MAWLFYTPFLLTNMTRSIEIYYIIHQKRVGVSLNLTFDLYGAVVNARPSAPCTVSGSGSFALRRRAFRGHPKACPVKVSRRISHAYFSGFLDGDTDHSVRVLLSK